MAKQGRLGAGNLFVMERTQEGYLSPIQVRTSLLSIYVAEKSSLDLWAIEQSRSMNRYDVAVNEATHFDFQNWPLYTALYGAGEARSAAVRSHEIARVKLTTDFLDGVLKDDRPALDRGRNGPFPRGFAGDQAQVNFHPSQ